MNIIKSLLVSSADPESISLFVKSLATFAVLFGLDSTVVNEGGGYLSNLLVGLGMVFSAGSGLYGLFRKAQLGRWSSKPSDFYN